jgi:hypothetical protein
LPSDNVFEDDEFVARRTGRGGVFGGWHLLLPDRQPVTADDEEA